MNLAKPILIAFNLIVLLATTSNPSVAAADTGKNGFPKPNGVHMRNGMPTDLGSGTSYYVSSSQGNDSNDGLSVKSAFRTVLPVNKLNLHPGDNVLFRRGDVFINAHLAPSGSGEARMGQWITVDAYGDGHNPLFKDGGKDRPAISLSRPQTRSGYRLRNIDVDGYKLGISSFKNSLDDAFDGLQIYNCSFSNITINALFDVDKRGPEGAPLAWAMWLRFANHVDIRNVTTNNCDSPAEIVGSMVNIDNFQAYNSAIQGLMLYSCETYADINKIDGHITVRNSKFINTGRRSFVPGSCGILVQNTKNCLIQNCEVAYTTNGGQAYDACGIDWEENNTDCVVDQCYVHDNDGPFLLHNDGSGHSSGNIISNSLSINNGRRDITAQSTFIVNSDRKVEHPRITVSNCIDVGQPGTVPYFYFTETGSKVMIDHLPADRIDAQGFISTTADIGATFDDGDLSDFTKSVGISVADSHLKLLPGAAVTSRYSGTKYIVNCYIKGQTDVLFYTANRSGYVWRFTDGQLVALKQQDSKLSVIKRIELSAFDVHKWHRIRIEPDGDVIKTYVDEQLVDTLTETSYRSGTMGFKAIDTTWVDELMVYRYESKPRPISEVSYNQIAAGGDFRFSGDWNKLEQSWTASDGIGDYQYKAYSVGYAEIIGPNAYIERKEIDVDVTGGYNTLSVTMRNSTTNPKLTVEFSTDGGVTWHTKSIKIRSMSRDSYPFNIMTPWWKSYIIDMSDQPAWKGRINGLRLRFGAVKGSVGVSRVVISKDVMNGDSLNHQGSR